MPAVIGELTAAHRLARAHPGGRPRHLGLHFERQRRLRTRLARGRLGEGTAAASGRVCPLACLAAAHLRDQRRRALAKVNVEAARCARHARGEEPLGVVNVPVKGA